MIKITEQKKYDEDEIKFEVVLDLIEANRNRVRTLSNFILTVSSVIFSTTFIVFSLIFKDIKVEITLAPPILLVLINLVLICCIFFAIMVGYSPDPVAFHSKLKVIDHLSYLYRKEYSRARLSMYLLSAGLLLYVIAIITLMVEFKL